jgi:secondary thiamine-phosphate synthase enzyme
MVSGKQITIATKGYSDTLDITDKVAAVVQGSGIREGLAAVFVIGSTASITTIEFEPALVADFMDELEQFIPSGKPTRHGNTWGDDNGFSHLRASTMGPGITVPVSGGRLVLGTWQQIVVVDHDNRSRSRKVFVQVLGE